MLRVQAQATTGGSVSCFETICPYTCAIHQVVLKVMILLLCLPELWVVSHHTQFYLMPLFQQCRFFMHILKIGISSEYRMVGFTATCSSTAIPFVAQTNFCSSTAIPWVAQTNFYSSTAIPLVAQTNFCSSTAIPFVAQTNFCDCHLVLLSSTQWSSVSFLTAPFLLLCF